MIHNLNFAFFLASTPSKTKSQTRNLQPSDKYQKWNFGGVVATERVGVFNIASTVGSR